MAIRFRLLLAPGRVQGQAGGWPATGSTGWTGADAGGASHAFSCAESSSGCGLAGCVQHLQGLHEPRLVFQRRMRSMRIRLVVPRWPNGTPAVITKRPSGTLSPRSAIALLATCTI